MPKTIHDLSAGNRPLNLPKSGGVWIVAASAGPKHQKPPPARSDSTRKLLKVSEAARILGLNAGQVEALCNPRVVDDPIPNLRLPKIGDGENELIRIFEDELWRWLERQRRVAPMVGTAA